SLVGNWLLELYGSGASKHMHNLDALLTDAGLRSKDDSAQTIFSKLVNLFSGFTQPKSVQVDFSMTENGLPLVSPKLQFDTPQPTDDAPAVIPYEKVLSLLNDALSDFELTTWVVLDRLDEAFQGFTAVEIPALRALFRTYLDLLAYSRVRLKLFVRNDV